VAVIGHQHNARLVIKGGEFRTDFDLKGKILSDLFGEQMTGEAFEAVPGFVPEIGVFIGDNRQNPSSQCHWAGSLTH
jgi:hypothetical protein